MPSACARPLPSGKCARKADIEHLFAEAKKAFGKIDILVNNAGVYDWSPFEEMTEEQFHKHFDVECSRLLLATQEAVKQFDSTGWNIINVSSNCHVTDPAGFVSLHRAQSAVDAITRTLAKELGPRKIRSTPSSGHGRNGGSARSRFRPRRSSQKH